MPMYKTTIRKREGEKGRTGVGEKGEEKQRDYVKGRRRKEIM